MDYQLGRVNFCDCILSLKLTHGGHLSHGFETPSRKISEAAFTYKIAHYHVDRATGLIDYEELDSLAHKHKPKLIIAGSSAYSRLIDYNKMRQTANSVGAYLHADMSHNCGLVAAEAIPSPFPFCDVVTTTFNKTFRGSDAAGIFFRRGPLADRINRTVFPRFQCGTNYNNIAGLAVALLQARSAASRHQQKEVISCARAFASHMTKRGYKIVSGGTDTHLFLVDLRDKGLDGSRLEKVLELVNVTCNRNTIPGDEEEQPGVTSNNKNKNSGIRLGAEAMVIRGFGADEFDWVAEIIDRAVGVAVELGRRAVQYGVDRGKKRPGDFETFVEYLDGVAREEQGIVQLQSEVVTWMRKYPPPGKA
ncbi:MAG: hypothetical protein Q9227_000671 [Pyrenula ochraceoflavens]